MHNSFIDDRNAAVEMWAVPNAMDLDLDTAGMQVPPAALGKGADELRPADDCSFLSGSGVVDMGSTPEPDGSDIADDIGDHVFVVITSDTPDVVQYLTRRARGGT